MLIGVVTFPNRAFEFIKESGIFHMPEDMAMCVEVFHNLLGRQLQEGEFCHMSVLLCCPGVPNPSQREYPKQGPV